nr:hypothetical protein [Bacteroides acidifaciens]
MKKNFVRVMLFGALTLAVSTTVTSCKDYDDDIKGLQEQVDKITSVNPVSTEDMKAAVDEATKALEQKVKDLKDLVDGKVTTSTLEAKIKDLEDKLAKGDKTVADELTKAKSDLQLAINGKASQATVDAINEDIKTLNDMKTTLQALTAAKQKYKDSGDLSGFENTSFDKFINESIKDALADEGDNKGAIAAYVIKAVQDGVASNGKVLNDHIASLGINGVTSLTNFVDKIYNEIFKEDGAIKSKLDDLDELLNAVNAYVGSGQGQLADYEAVINEIMATRDAVTALALPEGKNLTQAVQDIINKELENAKADLGKLKAELQAEIKALKGMIQSIVYVPESVDRTINLASLMVLQGFSTSNEFIDAGNKSFEKKVKFRVAPSSAVQYLVSGENQKYDISIDAQKLTRAATPFSITNVAAVDGEENLIEVTMVADDAFADVNGFATSLIVKGKDKDKELSDLASDYFAIVKQTVYIKDVAYSYKDMPTSLIKGSTDVVDFGNNGIITFTTVPNAEAKSEQGTPKTAAELGIDESIAKISFAMTGDDVAKNFDFNTDADKKDLYVLKPKATGTAGGEATITPTIVVAEQSKTGTAMTVKLIEKSEKVDLVVKSIIWADKEQAIEMTDDNLKAIEAAISKTATDLSAIESVTDNKSDAKDNAITFELASQGQADAAITLKVPAKAETQTVTAVLKLNTKEINLSAKITVDETKSDAFKWDKKPLLGDIIPLTVETAKSEGKVTGVTLTADLADVYVNFATWKEMAATEKKITLSCAAAPKIGTIDNTDYSYSLPAKDALPKGITSVSSIDVTYNVMCNKTNLNPVNKENVVTYSVPVEELNGKLSVPVEKQRAKEVTGELSSTYELNLTTGFNSATKDVDAEKNPTLLWNDAEGEAMWPTPDNEKYGSNVDVLPIYGLGISFEPADATSKTFIETYFEKGELAKGNLKFSAKGLATLPNALGTDLNVKLKVVATSKWGDVANSGTVFTVTFKKGCTVNKTVAPDNN